MYLKILEIRIDDKGIYLLDEPETVLSPLRQLSLLSMICETVKQGSVQFLIATHSSILMSIPEAVLYQISDDGMRQAAFEETDHYRITKTFLTNPEFYLRHIM